MQAEQAKQLFIAKKYLEIDAFLQKYALEYEDRLKMFVHHRYTSIRFVDGSILYYFPDKTFEVE